MRWKNGWNKTLSLAYKKESLQKGSEKEKEKEKKKTKQKKKKKDLWAIKMNEWMTAKEMTKCVAVFQV